MKKIKKRIDITVDAAAGNSKKKSKPLVHGRVNTYYRDKCRCRNCKKAVREYREEYFRANPNLNAKIVKRYKEKKLSKNLCTDCGKAELIGEYKLCENCRIKRSELQRKRRNNEQSNGLCRSEFTSGFTSPAEKLLQMADGESQSS